MGFKRKTSISRGPLHGAAPEALGLKALICLRGTEPGSLMIWD